MRHEQLPSQTQTGRVLPESRTISAGLFSQRSNLARAVPGQLFSALRRQQVLALVILVHQTQSQQERLRHLGDSAGRKAKTRSKAIMFSRVAPSATIRRYSCSFGPRPRLSIPSIKQARSR